VSAVNDGGGIAVYGRGTPAGQFQGDVRVYGDLSVSGDVYLLNKDIAERFPLAPGAVCAPGTVVVIGDDGNVGPCTTDYDTRAVGVVTAADHRQPAITLGAGDDPASSVAVALMGTVDCWVDAGDIGVRPGDLLTSSATGGHATWAADRSRRDGAVIGKALTALPSGRGLVRMLVMAR
jgi:hypothetical protein